MPSRKPPLRPTDIRGTGGSAGPPGAALLLDLDGTLADTAPDLAAALNRLLAEEGRPPLPLERVRPAVSHGTGALLRLAFGDGAEADAVLRARLVAHYRSRIAEATRLFAGMAGLLASVEARGLPWGIVTNKPAMLTGPLVAALGLAGRAGCVVSGDTLAVAKPHPGPLLHAAARLGVPPGHCLYLGDARRDVEAARRAGMVPLVALYGYLGPEDDPRRWGAAGLVRRPAEVLAWLGPRGPGEEGETA